VNIWGFRPKKRKIANFFAQQGHTPCPLLVKSIGFMRVIGLQKSPLAPKNQGGCKIGTDILYLHAKFGGDPLPAA